MKQHAALVHRRGRALPDEDFPPDFVRSAYTLAIRRAARDSHRAVCDRNTVECDACRDHTQAIAEAKRELSRRTEAL